MIKIRVQGTKDDISWLEKQIKSLEKVTKETDERVKKSSETYKNQGTKKYFRKYMEVEKIPASKES